MQIREKQKQARAPEQSVNISPYPGPKLRDWDQNLWPKSEPPKTQVLKPEDLQ